MFSHVDLPTVIIIGLAGIIVGMLLMAGQRVRVIIQEPERSAPDSPFGALGGLVVTIIVAVAIGFGIFLIGQALR